LDDQQPDWTIYCISHATKQAVEKHFGKDAVAGVADNAKVLAELMIAELEDDQVIFFCGDQRRDYLPDELRKNDIEVTEIIVYQTILLPHKIEKSYNGILFFSPTAVASFFQKNKSIDQAILFAIGETTANEIRNFSENKILVAPEPSKRSLLDEAIGFFEQVHH
jgi:uroporphyrinogen-III synthase